MKPYLWSAVFYGVHVARLLVFCVVFCRSLFVLFLLTIILCVLFLLTIVLCVLCLLTIVLCVLFPLTIVLCVLCLFAIALCVLFLLTIVLCVLRFTDSDLSLWYRQTFLSNNKFNTLKNYFNTLKKSTLCSYFNLTFVVIWL